MSKVKLATVATIAKRPVETVEYTASSGYNHDAYLKAVYASRDRWLAEQNNPSVIASQQRFARADEINKAETNRRLAQWDEINKAETNRRLAQYDKLKAQWDMDKEAKAETDKRVQRYCDILRSNPFNKPGTLVPTVKPPIVSSQPQSQVSKVKTAIQAAIDALTTLARELNKP
jgi:hypothetical protein